MNQSDYDRLVQGCESEKLHFSGAIQSFGAIIRIDRETLNITHASENIEFFIGVDAKTILSKNLNELYPEFSSLISDLPQKIGYRKVLFSKIEYQNIKYDIVINSDCNSGILLEFEQNIAPEFNREILYDKSRQLLKNLSSQAQLDENSNKLVQLISTLTNFDRVMIYKFLDDYSGEVIAEQTKKDIGSYLGLRFPASDIPAIARNIYMLNPSRSIADIDSKNVMILSNENRLIDLTYCDTRSVSPVHLEYLSNMGVKSSFSIPIKSIDSLWGLVACHNLEPKFLSLDTRIVCEELTQNYSIEITAFKLESKIKKMDSIEREIESILKSIKKYSSLIDGLGENLNAILNLLNSESFLISLNGNLYNLGKNIDMDILNEIDEYFKMSGETLLISDNISRTLQTNIKIGGVIGFKTKTYKNSVRIYWFRPEQLYEVQWAGNPNKPMVENLNATSLAPRKSFEKWIEVKRGFSKAWSNEDKMIVLKFKKLIQELF